MSLATYTDLQSAIEDWIAKSDSRFTGRVTDLIALAEGRTFKELRVRQMESAYDQTIATGTVPVPSDYIAFKVVYLNASPIVPLIRVNLETLYREHPTRSADGPPRMIARNAGNFEFGPYPDSNYEITGTYYANPVRLSGSASTNVIFPTYNDVYLWASLVEAAPFLSDTDMVPLWENKYQSALARANMQDIEESTSGSLIQPRAI